MATPLQILLGTGNSPQVARLRSTAVRQYEPLPRLVGGDVIEATITLIGSTGAIEASSGSGDLRMILVDGAGSTLAAATVYTAAASAWTLDLDLGTVAIGEATADNASASATLLVQQAVSSVDWRTWGRLPAYVYPDASASYVTPTPAEDYYTRAQIDAIVAEIDADIAAATADIATISASLATLSTDVSTLSGAITDYATLTASATVTPADHVTTLSRFATGGNGDTETLTLLTPTVGTDGQRVSVVVTGSSNGGPAAGMTYSIQSEFAEVESLVSTGQGAIRIDLVHTGGGEYVSLAPNLRQGAPLISTLNLSDLSSATTARTNLGIVAASTETAGLVELATDAETQAGASATLAVTPAGLASVTATETQAGLTEIATDAEVDAQTDAARVLTPRNVLAIRREGSLGQQVCSTGIVTCNMGDANTNVAAAAGTMLLTSFVGVSRTITNVSFGCGGAGPTGITLARIGIYEVPEWISGSANYTAGTLVASTADFAGSLGVNTFVNVALSSPLALKPGGRYYVGILQVGTTSAQLRCVAVGSSFERGLAPHFGLQRASLADLPDPLGQTDTTSHGVPRVRFILNFA